MEINLSYRDIASNKIQTPDLPMDCVSAIDNDLEDDLINLLVDDKNHLYASWQFSIIIKAFGSKFTHQYLKTKLEALWKLYDPLCLIDLGFNFFTLNSRTQIAKQ